MTIHLPAQINAILCSLAAHFPVIASALHKTAIVLHCGCQG